MKLGALSTFDTYPTGPDSNGSSRWLEALDLLQVAESEGLSAFWVTEHHFVASSALPSPPVWLAAAAQRTSRIRLGALVAVLALHNPRELAEEYALVDALSGGRLEIGIGTGYIGDEFWGFGQDPGDRREATNAALPEFLGALRGDALPAPGSRNGAVRLNVRPIQRPHPPIWRAAGRRQSVTPIGRSGDRLALVPYACMQDIGELCDWVRDYRRGLAPGQSGRIIVAMHVYVGPKRREGLAALQRFVDTRPLVYELENSHDSHGGSGPFDAAELCQKGLAAVGDTREVVAVVDALRESGVTDFAGIFDFGGLPSRDVYASIRRWVGLVESRTGREPTIATAFEKVGTLNQLGDLRLF